MADKDKLRAFLESAYDALEQSEAEGEKPDIAPDINTAFADIERVNEFTRLCRNQPAQVLAWIRELECITNEPITGSVVRPSFKAVYGKFLGALTARACGLDEKAAFEFLRDSKAVRNLLPPGGGSLGTLAVRQGQSRRASRERGSRPLKRAVAVIREADGTLTLDRLLEVFADGDRMEDLYHSTISPIDITDVQVDSDANAVRYRMRAQSPATQAKSVSFRRLRDLLAGR